MEVKIPAGILTELEYLFELQQKHYTVNPMKNTEELINYIVSPKGINTILSSIAEGSRNPDCWQRDLIERLGLSTLGKEHKVCRPHYGNPGGIKLCERFWFAYHKLDRISKRNTAKQGRINFKPKNPVNISNDDHYIMINLKFFVEQCNAHDIESFALPNLRRALSGCIKPLLINKNHSVRNKALGKTFKCWVFKK